MINSAPISHKEEPSYPVDIFIAGNVTDATRICREHCMDVGLCVHVVQAEYVYTGGAESGVKVGLINYPRFPSTPEDTFNRAVTLAKRLIIGLCQGSATVQAPDRTLWLTRRNDT